MSKPTHAFGTRFGPGPNIGDITHHLWIHFGDRGLSVTWSEDATPSEIAGALRSLADRLDVDKIPACQTAGTEPSPDGLGEG